MGSALSLEAALRWLDAVWRKEEEIAPLRKVVADLTLDKEMLQEVVRCEL
jgi:hypothetical protein